MAAFNIDPLKEYMNTTVYELCKKISEDFNLNLGDLTTKYSIMPPPLAIIETPTPKKLKKTSSSPGGSGRKKKVVATEFVEMTELMHEDVKYLVDNDNNIYTYDLDAPKLIGQKLVNGAVKWN